MRTIPILLALAAVCQAQSPEETKYEKKLGAAFIKNAAWVLDYDVAQKQAADSGKVMFAYFTRSFAP